MSMQPSGAPEKKALRQQLMALRNGVAPEQRAAWSQAIYQHVIALPAYQSARVVHCFVTIRTEVDTRPIIEHALSHDKRIAIPLFVRRSDETPACEITSLADEDYETDPFGLRVPRHMRLVDLDSIDLVLVPLLAFAPTLTPTLPLARGREERGWLRLGYGAGFYDRFLSRVRAPKVGIAFQMQRVAQLPREPHDILLDAVITEAGDQPA